MSDLERLREALGAYVDPLISFWNQTKLEKAHLRLIFDAARRYAEGTPIQWCEEHGSYFQEREPDKYSMCMAMLFEDAWDALPEPEACRIVSRWLSAPPADPGEGDTDG